MSENQPLLGAEHQGNEARAGKKAVCARGTIVMVVMLERLAFYGITSNFVLLLNGHLNWDSYNAVNAGFMLTGISYAISPLGGWVADRFLGRFKTIVLALLLYLGGLAIFPYLTNHGWSSGPTNTPDVDMNLTALCSRAPRPQGQWKQMTQEDEFPQVVVAIVLVALGSGVVKTNIAPLGADQVKQDKPEANRKFFSWYYWFINLGALLSLLVLAAIQMYFLQTGYLIPLIALALAFICFAVGRVAYVVDRPSERGNWNVCSVIFNAFSSRSSSATALRAGSSNRADLPPQFMDWAKMRYGGRYHDREVEDVKSFLRVLLVFATMVPYWIVYFQMETTFLNQGLHMRSVFNQTKTNCTSGDTNNGEFMIPPAWLTLFDVVFLVFLLPLLNYKIFPFLDRRGLHMTQVGRMAVGMTFAVIAVTTAGVVEWQRYTTFKHSRHIQCVGKSPYFASDMWIMWQIPQYALIGVSEAFTSVAGLEFAYAQAPHSMKTVIMGWYNFFTGVGSMLGTATIYSVYGWWFKSADHGDINCDDTHLDYYFYMLAGLLCVGLAVFFCVVRFLNLRRPPPPSVPLPTAPPPVSPTRASGGSGGPSRRIGARVD